MEDRFDDTILRTVLLFQQLADEYRKKHRPDLAARMRRVSEGLAERECGDCQFCCQAKGVEALGKIPWSDCEHQCETGCSIYAERPQSCVEYLCAYRCGLGGENARPDRAGALVEIVDLEDAVKVDPADPRDHFIGLVVRSDGPYAFFPVRSVLADGSLIGARHIAFAGVEADRSVSQLRYTADSDEIRAGLSKHAGTGKVPDGWVTIVDRKPIDEEE